jgi:hypothetical protein
VRHASRSSGLLHVEASLARVFQSDPKTDGGATVGGAHGRCDVLRRILLSYLCRFQCIRP